MWFQPTAKDLLFTRNDKDDPRLGESVSVQSDFEHLTELDSNAADNAADFFLYGYPDDEGISLNGGRPGAALAPRQIRTYLYKMTPALGFKKIPVIRDLGDLLKDTPLSERHERGRATARHLARQNKKFISLGGGHDYGYSDSCGFLDAFKNQAVVINFDAHLDVRPVESSFHSGTPFRRMLSEFAGQVDFIEVGLQPQCNSQVHFEWARQHQATLLTLADLKEGLLPALQNALLGKEKKKIFISVDIDAFTSSEAPGCSQSWATGLSQRDFFPAFEWLVQNHDVGGLGIYEVSPPLDLDHHTSKLAALIVHRFLFSSPPNGGRP
jgi:formiminoglutamase